MTKIILESLLRIAIILPFIFIFLKKNNKINFHRVALFIFCYIVYEFVLHLPRLDSNIDFIGGNWNWTGKIFGITWGIICYFLFKPFFAENNFFTIKQDKKNFKKAFILAGAIAILSTIIIFFVGKFKFDFETLAFQLTLPGIDEEIMYRGILLGLLLTSLKDKIPFLGNPAVLLTAVLFGFGHGLSLETNYTIHFNALYFTQTAFAGYIWGWVTLKSRSILLAILSHNFGNFFGTLSAMIK